MWLSQFVITYWGMAYIRRTEGLARLSKHKPPLEVWLSQFVIRYWGSTRTEGLANLLKVQVTTRGVVAAVCAKLFLILLSKATLSSDSHTWQLNYLLVLRPLIGKSRFWIEGSITVLSRYWLGLTSSHALHTLLQIHRHVERMVNLRTFENWNVK